MLNQNQSQSSFQSPQGEQSMNPNPQNYRKDSNPSNQASSKYSSVRPYQQNRDFRKSTHRERSRSNEHSPRQSYNDYIPGNNMKSQGQNNFNMNNRNNKPFYGRQNNERSFGDSNRFKKDKMNYGGDNYSSGYNIRYNPNKDDVLIIFQNNYFTFNTKDFEEVRNELKRELKDDIYNIYYNYCIPNIGEKIFRFTTNYSSEFPLKSKAVRIIADFVFDVMKNQSDKVTYLKMNFLIPENVIGFIIGINGKNINQIREETNAKIEVYSLNTTKNYRKVEISGVPQIIANAAEKIYIITRRYFNFNNEKILKRNEPSPQKDRGMRDNWDRDKNRGDKGDGYGMDRGSRDNDRRVGRYYDEHWNKNYNNNNDKDYKGMYNNKDRNDYKDMGYKLREGYRNYGNRDIKKGYGINKNNNNYNNDNYRDNGPRYRNNYDRGNNKYNYDKNKNLEEPKDDDNWSNKSHSKKSGSEYSEEIRSPNVENDGDWPEEREEKNDDINNQNLELGEERDIKDNINENTNNNENNLGINHEEKEINNNGENNNNNNNEIIDKENNNNYIGVSNIEYNNLKNNLISNANANEKDLDKEENMVGKEKVDIEEINNVLANDVKGNDKSCKINIYLPSEEIDLLNNSKNENIWINLENSFNISISKINKNIDNQEISLITFNGTLKQNTLAIYQLQKYLLDTKNEEIKPNEENN